MGLMDYIKPVRTISSDEFNRKFKDMNPEEFNLIDVRQPKEYSKEHIPGAILVPLGELESRLDEFDKNKPTVAYWAAGVRSRAAATILSHAGFKKVYSLAGGINAWKGVAATGTPEWGMAFFRGSENPEELIALSWAMEEGSRKFYDELTGFGFDPGVTGTFAELKSAEEKHETALTDLYYKTKITDRVKDYPDYFSSPDEAGEIIEGGFKLSEAIKWAKDKQPAKIYEFSLMIEAQHFDLYTRMARTAANNESAEVFKKIAAEEKKHLAILTDRFDKEL